MRVGGVDEEWNSVGIEPNLDAVGVVQADEHGPPLVADDDPAVGFTEVVQVRRPPRLDIGPGGHREGDRVETGQRGASSSTDSGVAGGSSAYPVRVTRTRRRAGWLTSGTNQSAKTPA